MKLYLVRHGETALNEKGCYYGKTDAVLSVRGIEQAKYLQHIFKEVSFDYVVASPLVRAYNTAQIIIEERKQQIFGDSRLMEQDFGIFEGLTYKQLKGKYPQEYCRISRKNGAVQRKKDRCPGALAVGRIHPMCGQSAVFSVITVS